MKKFDEYIIPINETAKDYDEMFVGIIRRQPVLTRCKNCKYWDKSRINYNEHVCYWGGYVKREDDFCSWAERRNDERME